MRFLFWIWLLGPVQAFTQVRDGSLEGAIRDSGSRQAIESATVELLKYGGVKRFTLTDKMGFFSIDSLTEGGYRLRISHAGHTSFIMDSITIRPDRKDVSLGELMLSPAVSSLETIVIYAEKPLIQTRDGNITVNLAESPLAAGSNAADLLKNIPLVTADADGRVTVRGKEPRILVDEKPVDLNGMQLADFLESLPGGMIERIEVMTNPPAQYAQEPGGVINIVTRKGKAGLTGRASVFGGTRGEAGANASLNYRKKGLAFTASAGDTYNAFRGFGTSVRHNFFTDSTNQLRTANDYVNLSRRPTLRFSLDYDLDARNSMNVVATYNGNNFDNDGNTRYANINNDGVQYRSSTRDILSSGRNINPGANFSFIHKGKRQGEQFKLQTGWNRAWQDNERNFRQSFADEKGQPSGKDSIQSQFVSNNNTGWNIRAGYDLPLNAGKTIISAGSAYFLQKSRVIQDSYYEDSQGDQVFVDLLSNDLGFTQRVINVRGSVKQKFSKLVSVNAGLTWEKTEILFDVFKQATQLKNHYGNWLPFAGMYINKDDGSNLSLIYRRTIRRPGIRELNPAIDYTDPYNLRSGNPYLDPTFADNIDLTLGKTRTKFYVNLGLGFNVVNNIFANIRTLIDDGKTMTTWYNIHAKKEYEASAWAGYTISKAVRLNASASYTFNQFSREDIEQYQYRNGGSIMGKLNLTYALQDLWSLTLNVNYNRFANPQGTVRSTVATNIGIQRKLYKKRLLVTLNMIDPIIQQTYRNVTTGTHFNLTSEGTTETRNFRLTLTYNVKFKT